MTQELEKRIGRVVRHLRRQRGRTQGDLAGRLGITVPSLSAKERGAIGISPRDWPTIAAVFEMTVEQFVALANEHNGPPQDDGLRQVAERWDRLPGPIRDAILALAKSGDQP